MICQFDNPYHPLVVRANNSQGARTQNVHVVRVDTETAAIMLLNTGLSVGASSHRIWLDCDAHAATNQRTGELRYEAPRCMWRGFLVLGIGKAQHVPRILQD